MQDVERREEQPLKASRSRGRSAWPLVGFAALAALVAPGGWYWSASKAEPEFYRAVQSSLADAEVRHAAAQELEQRAELLVEAVQHSDEWEQEFTQQQINSWLVDELPQQAKLPKGVQDPLVDLGDGVVQVGCWVDSPRYEGIVSIAVRPSVQDEATLALKVESIHAGKAPLPASDLIAQFSRTLERQGLPIEIDQAESDRILVHLRDAAPELREIVLTKLEITPQRVSIRGTSDADEPPAQRTAAQPGREL